MNAREFCSMTDAAKTAHVATLNDEQRRALVDAVFAHHARANAGMAARGVAGKPAATAAKATPAVSDAPQRAKQGTTVGTPAWAATNAAFRKMASERWAAKK